MNPASRQPVALLAAVAAVVLHGAIGLSLKNDRLGATGRAERRAVAVSVRMLGVRSDAAAEPPTDAPPARQAVAMARTAARPRDGESRPVAAPQRAALAKASRPGAATTPAGEQATVNGGDPGRPIASRDETPGSPAPADAQAGEPVDAPIYPVVLPPAAVLRYGLRRGAATGSAVLSWQPALAEGRYRLQLEGRLDEALLMQQISTGGFDSAGVAPTRFTDRRPRSGVRAVNFQRESAIVSFSGPSLTHPLRAGMQDRLSWMAQLAGIIAADAARALAGAQTRLIVVGTRGEADSWVFVSAGVQGEFDASPTVLLVREPRRLYDLRVEVWLDPSRHFLPLRARLGTWPAEAFVELVLDEEATGPR